MRILLMRALIAWWMIIGVWLVMIPLEYLLIGNFKQRVISAKETTREFWYGWE